MIRALGALILAGLLIGGTARAADDRPLDDPTAFERSFAASLYQFDACGDGVAGRMYRRALAERFAACPFTPEARSRFQRRTRAEQAKVRRRMDALIEANGGLPQQLDGMAETCHAVQASDDYRRFRARLDQYVLGAIPADAVLPAACDAAEITP